jgi:hypothetical protein
LIEEEYMNIFGRRIRLAFDEPWDSSKIIDGKVISVYPSAEGKTYCSVEDTLTGEVYIVTNRYKGEDLMHVVIGKKVIVAISSPKTREFTYDDPNFLSNLSYYGVGNIEIC